MWIGAEKEGKTKKIKTLFIDNKTTDVNDILSACETYKINRLYFGANRTYLDNIKCLKPLFEYIKKNKTEVVYETTENNLKNINPKLKRKSKIILTYLLNESEVKEIDCIKIDTLKNVFVCPKSDFAKTSLKKLNSKGMYPTDKEI